jgi:hypothetical protein
MPKAQKKSQKKVVKAGSKSKTSFVKAGLKSKKICVDPLTYIPYFVIVPVPICPAYDFYYYQHALELCDNVKKDLVNEVKKRNQVIESVECFPDPHNNLFVLEIFKIKMSENSVKIKILNHLYYKEKGGHWNNLPPMGP